MALKYVVTTQEIPDARVYNIRGYFVRFGDLDPGNLPRDLRSGVFFVLSNLAGYGQHEEQAPLSYLQSWHIAMIEDGRVKRLTDQERVKRYHGPK